MNENPSGSDPQPPPSAPPPANGHAAGAGDTPPPGAAGATATGGTDRAGRFVDALKSWGRTAAPVARRFALGFGEWLAALTWRRFWLLAVLAMIVAGILGSIMSHPNKTTVTTQELGDEPIDVNVLVRPAAPPVPRPGDIARGPHDAGRRPPPPASSAPPAPPAPRSPAEHATPPSVAAPPAAGAKHEDGNDDSDNEEDKGAEAAAGAASEAKGSSDGKAEVDNHGVHIVADDDKGRQVTVEVDKNGVHVAHQDARGGGGPTVTVPVPPGDDPAKLAAAAEAVRPQIARIVRDEVRRRLRRVEVVREQERGDWIVSMGVLLVLSLVIVKLVLGSKKKAELRARAATATAVEEGLKRQVVEANLKMMQAQVEPHFLFNTLASVDYLIETDPARASKMQKNLIQYLRAALPQMREGSATLGKEVALCRSYLEILKVRMEDRLQFALNVPAGLLSAQFPPMVLPTLVENAIKHGLEPKPEGGSLTVAANIAHGKLRVTVADTGLGFGAGGQPGTGVGLGNIRERLAALFGGAASLAIEANAPTGTIVTIELPYSLDPTPPPPTASGATPPGRTDPPGRRR